MIRGALPTSVGALLGSARRRMPLAVLVLAAAVIPYGSLSALQQHVLDGSVTKRVTLGRFLRSNADDAGYISYRVGQLKQNSPSRLPIYLIGGSAVRECIQLPADLQRAVYARYHVRTTVVMLASSNQSLAESLAIVDNLPRGRGVVVIGVNHTRFAYTLADAEAELAGETLLMRSPTLRGFLAGELGAAPPNSIAPGLRQFLASYQEKRGSAPFAGSELPYLLHRYGQHQVWSTARKVSRVALWLSNRGRPGGQFDANVGFNGRLLATLARRVTQRGMKLVIMEEPQDAAIVGAAFDRYKAAYQRRCRSAAARNAGRYIDPNPSATLVDGDFHDLVHLVPTGRVKWTPALATALGPSVKPAAASRLAPQGAGAARRRNSRQR